jgi:hypothetical protein
MMAKKPTKKIRRTPALKERAPVVTQASPAPAPASPPDFTAPPPAARRSSLVDGVRRYAEKHLAKGRPWWNAVVQASDDDLAALIGRARTLAGATGAVWRKRVQPLKAELIAQNAEAAR